ncbi:hypothetical protein IWX90DRAFT_93155 [Phyllosticta citrichinensis]|uniref:Uncharacterized protein n=1 Tax=Phyllosticta citrichinensis TaxID=1130410 RepID=A0ABR1XFE4_9PEZI
MEEWQESARPWLCSHVMAASLLVALCVRAERVDSNHDMVVVHVVTTIQVTRDVNPMLEYQLNTGDLDRRQLVCFILPVSRLPRDLRAGPGRKQGILVPCFVAMDSPTGPTVEEKTLSLSRHEAYQRPMDLCDVVCSIAPWVQGPHHISSGVESCFPDARCWRSAVELWPSKVSTSIAFSQRGPPIRSAMHHLSSLPTQGTHQPIRRPLALIATRLRDGQVHSVKITRALNRLIGLDRRAMPLGLNKGQVTCGGFA